MKILKPFCIALSTTFLLSTSLLSKASINPLAGSYTHNEAETQSQIFVLDDGTFCYTFMGGSLDLLVGGRWTLASSNSSTIKFQEFRPAQNIYPAYAKHLDRLGKKIEIAIDGYSMSNAIFPVFATSANDVQPTTFRPLFSENKNSWADSYPFPLMDANSLKYFYIGDMEVDEYNQPRRLRVTQYAIANFDTLRIGFNNRQTQAPLAFEGEIAQNTLQINNQRFGNKKELSTANIAELRNNCINPALGITTKTSPELADNANNGSLLAPIKTFYLDKKAISGQPWFDDSTIAQSADATPEQEVATFEQSQLKTSFEAIRDTNSLDSFLKLAAELAAKKDRINQHAPFIVNDFSLAINKANVSKKFSDSEKIFFAFVKDIYPKVANVKDESVQYNISVMASQGIAVAGTLKNEKINEEAINTLLPKNFDITTHPNVTLIYNLSCYYATHNQKAKMLSAIKQARLKGKEASQFKTDTDFNQYLNDKDFLAALQ